MIKIAIVHSKRHLARGRGQFSAVFSQRGGRLSETFPALNRHVSSGQREMRQSLLTINTGADLPPKRPPCLFAGVSPPPFSSSEAAALGLISVISNPRNHLLHGTHPQLLQEILRSPSCSSDGPSKPVDAPPTPCKQ